MEEVLDVLEGIVLIDLREDLIELVEVRSNEVQLLPAVEPSHLCLSLV